MLCFRVSDSEATAVRHVEVIDEFSPATVAHYMDHALNGDIPEPVLEADSLWARRYKFWWFAGGTVPANSAQHMLHSSSSTAVAAVENTAAATTWSPHCLHDAERSLGGSFPASEEDALVRHSVHAAEDIEHFTDHADDTEPSVEVPHLPLAKRVRKKPKTTRVFKWGCCTKCGMARGCSEADFV